MRGNIERFYVNEMPDQIFSAGRTFVRYRVNVTLKLFKILTTFFSQFYSIFGLPSDFISFLTTTFYFVNDNTDDGSLAFFKENNSQV